MIDNAVSKLATYALRTGLIEDSEYTWAVNTILDVLKIDRYTDPGQDWGEIDLQPCWTSCSTTPTPAVCWRKTPWSTATCSTPR